MNLRLREKTGWLAFSLAAGWLLARLLRMILHPLPHYEAESAMAWSTHLLMQGESPWALASYPASLNAYGIAYHFLCAPFAWIFGCTLPLHRSVSVACLLGAAGLVYAAARRLGPSSLSCAWAALACLAAWSINITPTARPDALVLLFYLGSLGLVEPRGAGRGALALSALLAAAAFYVKPYGILAAPSAGLSLALRGRWRSALGHVLLTAAVWTVLALWVRAFHPLYFEEVVLVNMNVAGADLSHRAAQWGRLLPECAGLIVLVLAGIALGGPGLLLERLRRPWLIPLIVAVLAFHFKLSLHSGAALTYFYQLALPCLVLAALAQGQGRPSWGPALALGILCFSLGWSLSQAPYAPLRADREGAARLKALLAPSQHPAGTGHAAAFLWDRGSVVFDYGQAEFALHAEPDHGWTRIFPYSRQLTQRRQRFEAALTRAVRTRHFGVLAIGEGQAGPLKAALDLDYTVVAQAQLRSPQVPYHAFQIGLFRPRTPR